MKHFLGLATAVLSVAVFTSAASAAPKRCERVDTADVVARSTQAVVWKELGDRPEITWHGCAKRSGETIDLAASDGMFSTTNLTRARLAGRYVAFVKTEEDIRYGGFDVSLEIVDLVNGKTRRNVPLVSGGGYMDRRIDFQVTGLALARTGALAWRAVAGRGVRLVGSQNAEPHDSVGVLDRRGAALLATGAPGTVAGFRLGRERVSWTLSGARQSAKIDGLAPARCGVGRCWPG